MLSYVFFIFFLFFLSKSCTVVFWALQLGISNLLSQEKKKSAGEYFLVKMCQQQSGLTSFFLFSLFLAANSNRFVCYRLFFVNFFPFFSSPQPSQMIRLFCRFFQDYFSFFFYYSLSDFGSFSSFSSESSALPLLDLLLSSVATAFLTEWKMRFLT